ncbi:MAG: ComEA family DNA-binding protein [Deltaproteobacteria bacterium]|nr:ComEA family DNA-binding protein [Deltaproteobacteria bacterium]
MVAEPPTTRTKEGRKMTHASKLMAIAALAASLMLGAVAHASEGQAVNINTASATELATLKGIGDAKAKAIIAYREKNGPFKTVDELNNVSGIGDKMLNNLRPQITVESTASAAAPAGAKQ